MPNPGNIFLTGIVITIVTLVILLIFPWLLTILMVVPLTVALPFVGPCMIILGISEYVSQLFNWSQGIVFFTLLAIIIWGSMYWYYYYQYVIQPRRLKIASDKLTKEILDNNAGKKELEKKEAQRLQREVMRRNRRPR